MRSLKLELVVLIKRTTEKMAADLKIEIGKLASDKREQAAELMAERERMLEFPSDIATQFIDML